MSEWEAFVLGLVQGLTEFLPISSSGHLVIGQTLFGLGGDHLAFDVFVHGATLVATVVYFRARLARMLAEVDLAYLGKLGFATLPVGFVGLVFHDPIEEAFGTPALVSVFLAVTGTALLSLYRKGRGGSGPRWREGRLEPTWGIALLIGCAQAVAILPGVSRSGSTIVAAIWLGLAPAAAAEFAFLLGIPAVAGAIVLEAGSVRESMDGGQAAELVWGAVAAFGAAFFAIAWVFRLLEREGFRRFGFYCWAVAIAFAAYLLLRGPGG